MIIKYMPNIFSKTGRLEFRYGGDLKSVGDIFRDKFKAPERGFYCIVGGSRVDWDYVPEPEDEVMFIRRVAGGGGFFNPLRIIFHVVTGGMFISFDLVQVGMTAIMMAQMPKIGGGSSDSPTYGWDRIGNTIGEGNIIPVLYGEHRVGGVVLEAFTESAGTNGKDKYLNVLLGLSEGEIHGIDTATINIANNDVSTYGSDIQTWTTLGTNNQSPLDNFSKVHRQYGISGVNLIYNQPYIYKTFGQCNSADLTVSFPYGLMRLNDEGKMKTLSVSFTVQYAHESTPTEWSSATTFTVSARSKSAVEHIHTVTFPTVGRYYIKINRTTGEHTGASYTSNSTLSSIIEVEKASLGYPYTALLGLRIKATDKISGAMPDINVICQGRILQDVRGYTASLENSSNPANIIYDLLTSCRYGLGDYILPEQIDIETFQDFADWCDEIVDYVERDPMTGQDVTKQQKRYVINFYLDTEGKAEETISKILSMCRAGMYWSGNRVRIVIERPQSAIAQTFCMANITADSYSETYVSPADIPNQIEVKILDEKDNFRRAVITAIDKSRLESSAPAKSIDMFGITDKARAKREALFVMKKLKSLMRFIKFESTIQAVICEPGDIIMFQHDIPQYGFGGSIEAVDATKITLDRLVPMESGKTYRLKVRKQNNTYATYMLTPSTTITTNELNVGAVNDADVVEGCIWQFGEIGKEAKPFRVQSITRKGLQDVEISAEEYNDSIFSDDGTIDVSEVKYSSLGLIEKFSVDGTIVNPDIRVATDKELVGIPTNGNGIIPPFVTNVTLFEEYELVGDVYKSALSVSFERVSLPSESDAYIRNYEIIYSNDEGETWLSAGFVSGIGNGRFPVEIGEAYAVCVKPYTNYGKTNDIELSANALDHQAFILGNQATPPAVTYINATGKTFSIIIETDVPIDPTLDAIEVYAATTNDRAQAVIVGRSKSGRIQHTGVAQNQTYYYWAKAVNTAKKESEWYPLSDTAGVACQSSTDPSDVLGVLSGAITDSELSQSLLDTINNNSAGVQSVEELLQNQWTMKITEGNRVTGVGSIMYPKWDVAMAYTVGTMVEGSNGSIYKALQSSTGKDPLSNPTYWQLVPYGVKSEFTILSDKFQVMRQDGTGSAITPFVIGLVNGVDTVGVNGQLVVDDSISARSIKTDELIVGENVTMGPNAVITWGQVAGGPATYQQSTDPIPLHPTFSRASTAYLANGTKIDSGKPRIEPGKFGGAIMVEEGTTNLLLPGQYNASDTTLFSVDTDCVLSLETTSPISGASSIKCVTPAVAVKRLYFSINNKPAVTAGLAYSGQMLVKGSGTVTFVMRAYNSSNVAVGDSASIDVTLTATPQLIKIENFIIPTGGVNLQIIIGSKNAEVCTIIADCYQLEQKPYATSFIDGTRAAESLTVPSTGMSPAAGTIEIDIEVTEQTKRVLVPGTSHLLFQISRANNANAQGICIAHNNSGFVFVTADDSNAQSSSAYVTNANMPNGWRRFAVTWDATSAIWYVDGVQKGIIEAPKLPSAFSSLIHLGCHPVSSLSTANSLIDCVRLSNYKRSAAEILASATSGLPMERDAYTTALFDFNTGIEWLNNGTLKTYNGVAWEDAATWGAPTGTYVGATLADTVSTVATNFNTRNDRNATAVVAPTVADATGTIDHTVNTDGSVDVSFEWSWAGTEADIDGFVVYVHDNGTTTPTSQKVLAATADASVQVFYLTPQRRAFILYGVATNHWYTFGVQAYRIVDQDVDATGTKKSAIVQPLSTATETTYGAYRPASSVAFAGDITGTIAGTAASTVVSNANSAYTLVSDIASDSKLTPVEKQDIRREWNAIYSEKSSLDAQATALGITTEKTTYDNSIQALGTYLNGGTAYTLGATPPSWITDANLSATTTIVGATFRSTFKTYYDAKIALINKMAAVAATKADWTGVSGTGKPADYATKNTASSGTTPHANPQAGDTWFNSATTDGTYYALTSYSYNGTAWIPSSPRGTYITNNGVYTGLIVADQVQTGGLRGINVNAASHTTKGSYLTQACAAGATTLYVHNTEDFPTSGEGWLLGTASSIISWTGKTATSLTGVSVPPSSGAIPAQTAGTTIVPNEKVIVIDDASNEIIFLGNNGTVNTLLCSIGIASVDTDSYIINLPNCGDHFGINLRGTNKLINAVEQSSAYYNDLIYAKTINQYSVSFHGIAVGADGTGVVGRAEGARGAGVYGYAPGAGKFGVYGKCETATTGYDFYAGGAGVNYGPFTGSHDGLVLKGFCAQPGDILVDVAVVERANVSNAICQNDLSTVPQQQCVVGVYLTHGPMDTKNPPSALWDKVIGLPNPIILTLCEIYDLAVFNAVGEGLINVCKDGGDIQAGDYICSSSRPGKGMRQDDDLLHNYTVAKAREDCIWAEGEDDIRMIACTYHCG